MFILAVRSIKDSVCNTLDVDLTTLSYNPFHSTADFSIHSSLVLQMACKNGETRFKEPSKVTRILTLVKVVEKLF